MIYPDYLADEVRKYCIIAKIPFRDGSVPKKHTREVEDFIIARMKKERLATRRAEEQKKFRVKGGFLRKWLETNTTTSPIEEYLLAGLKNEGLDKHFERQYSIGTKTVDFACIEARLIVECDGREYHHTDQEQIERDQKRDKYLARKGWRVLHIEGLAIRRNINLCMQKIKEAIEPWLKECSSKENAYT